MRTHKKGVGDAIIFWERARVRRPVADRRTRPGNVNMAIENLRKSEKTSAIVEHMWLRKYFPRVNVNVAP